MIQEPQRHGGTDNRLHNIQQKDFFNLSVSVPLWLSLIFILMLFVFGCGKKLPPVAPESLAPEPVKEMRAVSREGKIFVAFKKPASNIDGSKITDLAGFKIMRRTVEDKSGCKTCPEKFDIINDIDLAYPKGATIQGDRIYYTDATAEPGMRYEYKVAAYNKDGYSGPESPKLSVSTEIAIGKPTALTGTAGDKAADLKWMPPESTLEDSTKTPVAGYNVYRRNSGQGYPMEPVNPAPVKETSYSDYGLKNNTTYYYTVRAVTETNGSMIEGVSADEIELTPKEAVFEDLKGDSDASLPVQGK